MVSGIGDAIAAPANAGFCGACAHNPTVGNPPRTRARTRGASEFPPCEWLKGPEYATTRVEGVVICIGNTPKLGRLDLLQSAREPNNVGAADEDF